MGVVGFPVGRLSRGVERHRSRYFDRKWLVSKRGNRYVRCGEFCVAVFRAPDGWKHSITRSAIEGPVYSKQAYVSAVAARAAAWEALVALVEPKQA